MTISFSFSHVPSSILVPPPSILVSKMSYYDDDFSINSDDNSSFTYDDDDDDSSEFSEHQDLDHDTFKTSFGTGTFEANEQQEGKEDMKMINVDGSRKDKATAVDNTCINPTHESLSEGNCLDQDVGRSLIGYSEGSKLEMAKSRVGIVGESSWRFLEMAKSRVGIVGESSGRFLEMAKTRVNTVVESNGGYVEMAKTSVVVGSAVIGVGWSLYRILSSDSSPSPSPSPFPSSCEKEKMMKAPGKIGEYIVREPFEDNPREYFRQLHNSKRREVTK